MALLGTAASVALPHRVLAALNALFAVLAAHALVLAAAAATVMLKGGVGGAGAGVCGR